MSWISPSSNSIFALFISLATLALPAQDVAWWIKGTPGTHQVAPPSILLSDMNGDGYREIAHVSIDWLPGEFRSSFNTMILSGKDGSVFRHDLTPSHLLYFASALVAAGDFNGDGVLDYVRSRVLINSGTNPNIVEVFSGKNGKVIWGPVTGPRAEQFGDQLAGNLDLDGDGKPDLLINARTGNNNKGTIYAYSNSGTLLYKVPALFSAGTTGWAFEIAPYIDLDGDGCDDFLVSGPEGTTRGALHIFSGKTGSLIRTNLGEPGDGLGCYKVKRTPDFDGDGVDDYLGTSSFGFGALGSVIVFSGKTGKRIHRWIGSQFRLEGESASVADFDQDSVPDVMYEGRAGYAYVTMRSGRDGTVMGHILPNKIPKGSGTSTFGRGNGITAAEPMQGDSFPTVLISEGGWDDSSVGHRLNAIGRLTRFRTVPSNVRLSGMPCTNTLPRAPKIGFRLVNGTTARIHLSLAPPESPSFLVVGISKQQWGSAPLPLDMRMVGLPGCLLHNSIEVIVPVTTGKSGIDSGYAKVDVPRNAALPLYAQWIVFDKSTGGVGMSASLTW